MVSVQTGQQTQMIKFLEQSADTNDYEIKVRKMLPYIYDDRNDPKHVSSEVIDIC